MKYLTLVALLFIANKASSQTDSLAEVAPTPPPVQAPVQTPEASNTEVLVTAEQSLSTVVASSVDGSITAVVSSDKNGDSNSAISKDSKDSKDSSNSSNSSNSNSEDASIQPDDAFQDGEVVGDDESDDDSGDSIDGQPGRITMITPPSTIANPLFELNSVVKLSWKYSKDMTSPPNKLMIIGMMPNNGMYNQQGTNLPITWTIAPNITGTKYSWNTATQVPQGVTLGAMSGYKMVFYDGDIGFVNGSSVHKGQLLNFQITFSMYRSEYANTNDGVPKNYNPNSTPRHLPQGWIYFFVSVSAILLGFM